MVNYNGNFPNNYQDILKLKGVGPYTAAAITSFALLYTESDSFAISVDFLIAIIYNLAFVIL